MPWNLKSIYSDSQHAVSDLANCRNYFQVFRTHLNKNHLEEALLSLQEGCALLKQLESYTACLLAQNPADTDGSALQAECSLVRADAETALFLFGTALAKSSDFDQLTRKQPLLAFFLHERRNMAQLGLDAPREELVEALSVDGYHAYWSLYRLLVGKMQLNFRGEQLSMGRADNLLSHPDRSLRQELFPIWNRTWKEQSDLLAAILNHLAGFRLQVYGKRGWNLLDEPLSRNRMQAKSLEAMWAAAKESQLLFQRYFAHKAKRMGLKKLSWHDLQAPSGSGSNEDIPYSEGVKRVLREFESYHPPLAAFSKKAIEKEWVEWEDRPGKQAGGFCVTMPVKGESRIFMTYQNTLYSVVTLAHELGHAYHSDCVKDLPYFAQEYRMNVAETASTLAEAIIAEEAMKTAKSPEEKCFMLDDKLMRAATFLMNLYARFLFEKSFYEERKNGFVSAERLTDLMVNAQKEAFGDVLEEYSPYFWASKLHFFLTDEPFYNFPYTVGFLLSKALYDKKAAVDPFLKDSARCTVEELAKKHLHADLTTPKFWKGIIDQFSSDLEEFVKL